jgi:hypothetical protein
MTDTLYDEIIATASAPRAKIAEYLNAVSEEVSELSPRELLARSGESQFREPKAKGEIIASRVLHALLNQDIVEDDSALLEIRDIAQKLTSETQNAAIWAEFVERVHALKAE